MRPAVCFPAHKGTEETHDKAAASEQKLDYSEQGHIGTERRRKEQEKQGQDRTQNFVGKTEKQKQHELLQRSKTNIV